MWVKLKTTVAEHKAGDIIDCDEAIARSYIAGGLAEETQAAEPEGLRVAREEFEGAMRGLMSTMTKTVKDATSGLNRPNVNGDCESEEEKKHPRTMGGYVEAVYRSLACNSEVDRNRLSTPWKDGGYGVQRGMTEGSGPGGGYTTPVLFESQILEIMGQEQVIVPKCKEVPLGARQVEWPALDQYQAPTAGNAAWFGGVKVYRKTEVQQRVASAPLFTKVVLNAADLTAYTEISRDLLQDSTATLDAMVPQLFGRAIGWREDYEVFNGTGAGNFNGILNAACSISVTRNTGSAIKYVDLVTMYSRLLSGSKKNACWFVHPYTMADLLQIQDGASHYVMIPFASTTAPLAAPVEYRMLGLPVYETEVLPTTATAGALILADASHYLIGRRSGIEIGLSEHFKFDTDQVAFRAKVRNDGQPEMRKAITLADGAGTNTVSAFVYLT